MERAFSCANTAFERIVWRGAKWGSFCFCFALAKLEFCIENLPALFSTCIFVYILLNRFQSGPRALELCAQATLCADCSASCSPLIGSAVSMTTTGESGCQFTVTRVDSCPPHPANCAQLRPFAWLPPPLSIRRVSRRPATSSPTGDFVVRPGIKAQG